MEAGTVTEGTTRHAQRFTLSPICVPPPDNHHSYHLRQAPFRLKTELSLFRAMDTFTDYSATLLDSTTGIPKSETGIRPPNELDIFRYRYHHGVNCGSIFVLEQWLTPSMYAQGTNSSELAAVTAAISHGGVASAQKQWEAHWESMLSDSDLDWLANTAHCMSCQCRGSKIATNMINRYFHTTSYRASLN